MTPTLQRPGRPSEMHEHRSATLTTLAVLTGHTHTLPGLPGGLRPDVLQLRPEDGSLFLGDAKNTETPSSTATFNRLSRYADFAANWVAAGHAAVLALIVDQRDAYGWLRVLRDLALAPSGGIAVPGQVDVIEWGSAVVWHRFPPASRRAPLRQLRR